MSKTIYRFALMVVFVGPVSEFASLANEAHSHVDACENARVACELARKHLTLAFISLLENILSCTSVFDLRPLVID